MDFSNPLYRRYFVYGVAAVSAVLFGKEFALSLLSALTALIPAI